MRSATSSRSSAPIRPPTSQGRSCRSTAASCAGCIESPRVAVNGSPASSWRSASPGWRPRSCCGRSRPRSSSSSLDSAKPLTDRVEVEGARPRKRRRVLRGRVRPADVAPGRPVPVPAPGRLDRRTARKLLPAGTSEADRDRQTAAEMQRSELVASAVALRALGYDVEAKPQGALVVERGVTTSRRRRRSSPET